MSDIDTTYWAVLRALLRSSSPGPFVDAGANAGDFSAQLLEEFPERQVIAFEPTADLCRRLGIRFADDAKVTIENAALWREDGEAQFEQHEVSGTSSLFGRQHAGRRYFSAHERVVDIGLVKTMTLYQYAAERGHNHFAFAKLDTQGAELAILQGATELLRRAAIDVIYTEFFVVPHYQSAPLLPEIWQFLRAFGYDLYDLFKGPHGRNGQASVW